MSEDFDAPATRGDVVTFGSFATSAVFGVGAGIMAERDLAFAVLCLFAAFAFLTVSYAATDDGIWRRVWTYGLGDSHE